MRRKTMILQNLNRQVPNVKHTNTSISPLKGTEIQEMDAQENSETSSYDYRMRRKKVIVSTEDLATINRQLSRQGMAPTDQSEVEQIISEDATE